MKNTFAQLSFTVLLILAGTTKAFASGGPVDTVKFECALQANVTPLPLVVFHLEQAMSSEGRGHVIIYDDMKRLDQPLTSMEYCFEPANMKIEPAVTVDAKNVLVCGSGSRDKVAKKPKGAITALKPNKAGYRALFWRGSEGSYLAKVERMKNDKLETVYDDLKCSVRQP